MRLYNGLDVELFSNATYVIGSTLAMFTDLSSLYLLQNMGMGFWIGKRRNKSSVSIADL